MKRSVVALYIAALVFPSLGAAQRIAVDIGPGIHNTDGADALFLRYADDMRQLILPGQSFYEWSFGVWDGNARNNGVGFALGTRGSSDKFHVEGSVGVAYVEDKTQLSGTHQQFSARLGVGVEYRRLEVGLFVTHYSNAKGLFGWDGPNAGYDFVTLQIGYPLR
ncbi:MAG TPA: acyloxyacyl hydrolase [Burkholderiales bacterium]|nr:acyloxyacyl hydrolase [Burkholderiales bacterium]